MEPLTLSCVGVTKTYLANKLDLGVSREEVNYRSEGRRRGGWTAAAATRAAAGLGRSRAGCVLRVGDGGDGGFLLPRWQWRGTTRPGRWVEQR